MQNVIKVLVGLMLVGSFAMARVFIGVEASGGKSTIDLPSNLYLSSEDKVKGNRNALGLKIGADLKTSRFYFSYINAGEAKDTIKIAGYDHDVTWTSHQFLANGEYTPRITGGLKAILGGYLGLSYIDVDTDPTVFTIDGPGFIIGLKVGAKYDVGEHHSFELGAKGEAVLSTVKNNQNSDTSSMEEDNIWFFAGYNYKF